MWFSNVRMKPQNLKTLRVGVELLCSSFSSYTAKFLHSERKIRKEKKSKKTAT